MCDRNISPSGVMLILAGVFLLIGQFTPFGLWTLPILALIFLAWGVWTRSAGLFIPAGILGGLAAGIGLEAHPLSRGQPEGAAFMLAFAAGWALIPMLTAALGEPMRWPLIPAGILGFIGLGLLLGGPALTILQWAGKLWPLILVALGLNSLRQTAKPQPRPNADR